MNNLQQLKTKNKKIYHLKPEKPPFNYQLPIINLSDFEIDITCLKYRLNLSLISTKIDSFNLTYNHFHNILRLFDVLPNFRFTANETMGDYYIKAWYIRVASRVAKRVKT